MGDKRLDKSQFIGSGKADSVVLAPDKGPETKAPIGGDPSVFISDSQPKGPPATGSVFLIPQENTVQPIDSGKLPLTKFKTVEVKKVTATDVTVKTQTVLMKPGALPSDGSFVVVLKAKYEVLKQQVSNTSPIVINEHLKLIRNLENLYRFVAICLFSFAAASVISSVALKPMISSFSVILLLAIVLVPLIPTYTQAVQINAENRRVILISVAVVDGIFWGLQNTSEWSIYGPPAFFAPLSIYLIVKYFGIKMSSMKRAEIWIWTLGPAAVAYMFFALGTYHFTIEYLFWAAMLTVTGIADLQLKLVRLVQEDVSIPFEELVSIMMFVSCHSICVSMMPTNE